MSGDEIKLIKKAQAGDPDAFAALYDQHQSAVFTYIYYRVNDQATAEELTAEVFCRMVEKIAYFRYRGRPFLAWLYTIARNLLTDHYRQSAKATAMPLREDLVGRCGNPVTYAEKRLADACLRLALQHLTEQQQQVIIAKFIEGRPNVEVANLIRKTEGAVKSLQHRALAALRRAIEKEGCYEP